MFRTSHRTWLLGYFLLVGMCVNVSAQSYGQQAGTPIMLFDGQSINGWTKANGQPHPGWVVEDGTLFRKAGGGDLFHEETWRDFELHFQWKISKGGNSGLKYRVKKYGNAWLGCEFQLLDDANTKEKNKTAGLYAVYDPVDHKPIVQPEVWQSSKIVVCGDRIQHWLNGVLVVQANVGSADWKSRVADSKFRDRPGFGENRDGRIFLQDHGNPVWFRQIILVPLNCDSAVAQSTPNINQTPSIPLPSLPSASEAWVATPPIQSQSLVVSPSLPNVYSSATIQKSPIVHSSANFDACSGQQAACQPTVTTCSPSCCNSRRTLFPLRRLMGRWSKF